MLLIYNELTYNEFCLLQTNKNVPAKLVLSLCKTQTTLLKNINFFPSRYVISGEYCTLLRVAIVQKLITGRTAVVHRVSESIIQGMSAVGEVVMAEPGA